MTVDVWTRPRLSATDTPSWDSGVVQSGTTGPIVVGVSPLGIPTGTYDVYVVVTSSDGATSGFNAFATFTISYTAPAQPNVTYSYDATNNRVVLTVTDSTTGTSAVITRSDGWIVRSTRAGLPLIGNVTPTVTTFDYEAQPNTPYSYTAVVFTTGPLVSVVGA